MSRSSAAKLTGALVVLIFAASLAVLLELPAGARIPIHFSANGEEDGWARAAFGLFMIPALMAAIWLLILILPQIDPRGKNLLRSGSAYGTIWVALILMLCVSQALIIATALGAQLDVTRIRVAAAGLMFIAVGNVLGKLRWNYTVGIRTPWTLADQRVWDKTHRFGGWLFVIGGFAIVASVFVPLSGVVRVWLLIAVIAAVVVLSIGKSYFLWRQQHDEPGEKWGQGNLSEKQ
jgi:uncharacterized membrane protein